MKQFYRLLLIFSLPLWLTSCEEGVFGPRQPECLETRQTNNSGQSTERSYAEDGISEIRYFNNNGELQSYLVFTYGADDRISESQHFNAQNNPTSPLYKITYNEKGKWTKLTIPYANGDIITLTAGYDNQDQIQKYTYSTTKSDTTTVNYTITYEWEGGNNTRQTYTSPTQQQVIQYAFDLGRENKRRKQQEKLAFLSAAVAYNKNMYQRVTSAITTGGTTTESVSEYSWQYNEEGYPTRLTRTNTTGSGTPTTATTDFYYDCN